MLVASQTRTVGGQPSGSSALWRFVGAFGQRLCSRTPCVCEHVCMMSARLVMSYISLRSLHKTTATPRCHHHRTGGGGVEAEEGGCMYGGGVGGRWSWRGGGGREGGGVGGRWVWSGEEMSLPLVYVVHPYIHTYSYSIHIYIYTHTSIHIYTHTLYIYIYLHTCYLSPSLSILLSLCLSVLVGLGLRSLTPSQHSDIELRVRSME